MDQKKIFPAPVIHKKPGWHLSEKAATDEKIYFSRRKFLGTVGATGLIAGFPLASARAATDESARWDALYPVTRNDTYKADRELSSEREVLKFNNFYEFGSHKKISKAAQKLKSYPWTVVIGGAVKQERTIDIDDLLKQMPLEERVLRHRCVEAWAMTVPWSGFPLKALVDLVQPLSSAKYVRFETLADKETMPGLSQVWYPWAYTEGITIAEARNDLAFIATGLYGKPIAKQNGAPLRLVLPWKYGFKSIKSITRIDFVDKRPLSFWEEIQPREYGFWANVNPDFPHPRWSQASERLLGSDDRVPTQLYNGYGAFVSSLYSHFDGDKRTLFF